MIRKFPDDHEKFKEISDQININKKYNVINEKCNLCGSFDHNIMTN